MLGNLITIVKVVVELIKSFDVAKLARVVVGVDWDAGKPSFE